MKFIVGFINNHLVKEIVFNHPKSFLGHKSKRFFCK